MIYLQLLIDYVIYTISPLNSYLVINDLDKNSILDVIITGLIIDTIFIKLPIITLILVILYFIIKKLHIKNKYNTLKNIILYLLFFNILYILSFNKLNYYILSFITGLIIEILFLTLKKLFK